MLLKYPEPIQGAPLAGLLFHEEWRDLPAEKIHGCTLHAPYLLQTEIASVALKKHRRGFTDLAVDALTAYAALDMNLHSVEPHEALALAQRFQRSADDAAYRWLAAELKAPLATFDEQLGRAAQAHLAGLD